MLAQYSGNPLHLLLPACAPSMDEGEVHSQVLQQTPEAHSRVLLLSCNPQLVEKEAYPFELVMHTRLQLHLLHFACGGIPLAQARDVFQRKPTDMAELIAQILFLLRQGLLCLLAVHAAQLAQSHGDRSIHGSPIQAKHFRAWFSAVLV
jgi:hypothetical protein